MRTFNLLEDIESILYQLAIAIPEIYLSYDVAKVEVQCDDVDRPTVWDIVFVESDETELVIGEIVLSEDFSATFEIFSED